MSHNSRSVPLPTRKLFEQHPRARGLRNLSLQALDVTVELLDSGGSNSQALEELDELDQQFLGQGIVPDMHAFEPDDPQRLEKSRRLASDPVLTAEYVAGQVRKAIGLARDLDANSPETHAELGVIRAIAVKGSIADLSTPSQLQHLRVFGLVEMIKRVADYNAGPSKGQ